MTEQTDLLIRTDQRALLTSKLKRGQLFEESPRVREALQIWTEVVGEASEMTNECRDHLQMETAKLRERSQSSGLSEGEDTGDDNSGEGE